VVAGPQRRPISANRQHESRETPDDDSGTQMSPEPSGENLTSGTLANPVATRGDGDLFTVPSVAFAPLGNNVGWHLRSIEAGSPVDFYTLKDHAVTDEARVG